MLATGFRDLSKVDVTAVPAATDVSPAAPAPTPAAPAEVPEPRRTYGPNDITVTAPVVVTQGMPPWRPSQTSGVRQYRGALALVIDEHGKVESVVLLEGVQPE